MAASYEAGAYEALAEQRARVAAERGWSAGTVAAARERRREQALLRRWHLLRHHPGCFAHPGTPSGCHLHR